MDDLYELLWNKLSCISSSNLYSFDPLVVHASMAQVGEYPAQALIRHMVDALIESRDREHRVIPLKKSALHGTTYKKPGLE